MPENHDDKLAELGLVLANLGTPADLMKPKQRLPELDEHNLHIALSRLQTSGYKRMNDVASILVSDLRTQIEQLRSKVEGTVTNDFSIVPTDPDEFMDGNNIALGLLHLYDAKYDDIIGVAEMWSPDFRKRIEMLDAKDISILPALFPSSDKRGWSCLAKLCYRMDKPISSDDLTQRADNINCHTMHDFEIRGALQMFPDKIQLPVATPHVTEFTEKVSGVSPSELQWHVFSKESIELADGKMPPDVTYLLMCEPEFWLPLVKR